MLEQSEDLSLLDQHQKLSIVLTVIAPCLDILKFDQFCTTWLQSTNSIIRINLAVITGNLNLRK